jgi:putative heme-binding domain-containing protein
VKDGTLRITSPADQLALFDYLASEGPTPFALAQIGGQLHAKQPDVRDAAHRLARSFGDKSASLAPQLWPAVLGPKTKFEDAVVDLGTTARIEKSPAAAEWTSLLKHPNPLLRVEAVRWWRAFKNQPELVETLRRQVPELVKENPELREDLASVFAEIAPTAVKEHDLPTPIADKEELTKRTLAALLTMSPADRAKRAALGQQVFERAACTKCHTTATATTPLAPSLKGIAAQKTEYLIESILYPSKVIKTGFESESIVTTSGKVLSGLVKDEGDAFRVLNLDVDVRVPKTEVESRSVSRVSIMPEGQELRMSSRELVDLVAYLATLK